MNFFIENVPEKMRSFIKCIQPITPRATNAIFDETAGGRLIYKTTEYDISREWRSEYGHVIPFEGDSGSPYWRRKNGKAVLVALHAGDVGRLKRINEPSDVANIYLEDPDHQCRGRAIKITQNMLDWLKEAESFD